MLNKPCHVGSISCGQPCGKQLPCGHGCAAQCHAGDCKPCSRPCGARRVHCSHACQADCHPGTPCEDVPCRSKVKQSCPCGRRVEEKTCGAFSGLPRPQYPSLRCLPSCERAPLSPTGLPRGEVVQYTAELFQLATHHRKFVQMLEDTFVEAFAASGKGASTAAPAPRPAAVSSAFQALPPCDASRRLLATEYARLHWRFKTSSKADGVEGWWVVQVAPGGSSRLPRPLLSEIARESSTAVSHHLLPALSSQPCLRFLGLKALDEVYELIGMEGLLGVRPGESNSEAIAFVERGSTGAAIFRRLTGQEPGAEAVPVRGPSAWGQPGMNTSRPRVMLEQTLTAGPRPEKRLPKPALPDAWDTKEGEVAESWEDM
mmetsp:Transcript_39603/g.70820  ORF Transcript_39603/g.70820 Transcript_39603/m.70820 type:complete len:373 (+) Transcript_39603:3-1121(+)